MKNKSIFTFRDVTSLGIETVPMNSLIIINAVLGAPKAVIIIDDTGLDNTSTIQNFLDDPSLYKEVGKDIDLTPYLKTDGSLSMDSGYSPINDLDIATKEYTTNSLGMRIFDGQASAVSYLYNGALENSSLQSTVFATGTISVKLLGATSLYNGDFYFIQFNSRNGQYESTKILKMNPTTKAITIVYDFGLGLYSRGIHSANFSLDGKKIIAYRSAYGQPAAFRYVYDIEFNVLTNISTFANVDEDSAYGIDFANDRLWINSNQSSTFEMWEYSTETFISSVTNAEGASSVFSELPNALGLYSHYTKTVYRPDGTTFTLDKVASDPDLLGFDTLRIQQGDNPFMYLRKADAIIEVEIVNDIIVKKAGVQPISLPLKTMDGYTAIFKDSGQILTSNHLDTQMAVYTNTADRGQVSILQTLYADRSLINDNFGDKSTILADGSTSTGTYSLVQGLGTANTLTASSAFGMYNEINADSILEIGIGTDTLRKNALDVKSDGRLIAPSLTNFDNVKSLITKEYMEDSITTAIGSSLGSLVPILNEAITTPTTDFFMPFEMSEKSLIFVDGVLQDEVSYTIMGSKITFNNALINNQHLTVFEGRNFDLHSEYGATSASGYTITPSFTLKDGIMIFVDGFLQDSVTYDIASNTVTLNFALNNSDIKILSTSLSFYFKEKKPAYTYPDAIFSRYIMDDAIDSLGNSTMVGTAGTFTTTLGRYAFSCNGLSEYRYIDKTSTGKMNISFYMYESSVFQYYRANVLGYLSSDTGSTSNYKWLLGSRNGYPMVGNVAVGNPLPIDQWNHFSINIDFDTGDYELFINGDDSATGNYTKFIQSVYFQVGGFSGFNDIYTAPTKTSELILVNSFLTKEEVQRMITKTVDSQTVDTNFIVSDDMLVFNNGGLLHDYKWSVVPNTQNSINLDININNNEIIILKG